MCSSFPGLLIGRTAVHSGKDPAFVAYDQFLSTGILQPLSRGEVRCGSKPVKLGTSKCFQVCPRKRTYLPILELLRPSTLSERRHRGLARRGIAVRWRAVFVLAVGERLTSAPSETGGSGTSAAKYSRPQERGRALLGRTGIDRLVDGLLSPIIGFSNLELGGMAGPSG